MGYGCLIQPHQAPARPAAGAYRWSRALKSSFSSCGTGGGGWGVRGIRRTAESGVEESARFSVAGPDSAHDRVGNIGENIVLERNTLQRGLSLLSLRH